MIAPLPPGRTRPARQPAPALTAAEAAAVQRFDAAETPPEVLREQVAIAIHQEQNRGASWHLAAGYIRDEYRRVADAAIAALDGAR